MLAHYMLDCGHTHALLVTNETIADPARVPHYALCRACRTMSIIIELVDRPEDHVDDLDGTATSLRPQS